MNTLDSEIYEQRARVMKALAHPSRLKILDSLTKREMCVCELQKVIGASMPTVSRHLAQMREAGIIAARREGNQVYYHLLVPCISRVFPCIDEVLRAEAEKAAHVVNGANGS